MGDKILEVGAAGIEGTDAKVRVMMNNMVNSETPGFRKTDVVIRSFPTYLEAAQKRSSTQVPVIEGIQYDQTPGTLLRTGNATDISIGGEGFFVVETNNGDAYTRDGRFTIDPNGNLVTVSGNYPVKGLEGKISIPLGSKLEISGDGGVVVDNGKVNVLKVVKIKDTTKLKAITGSLFRTEGPVEVEVNANPRVVSGYVEASNSNIIEEMMNLIYLSHAYNANAKIVTNRETMLTRALDMGKPAQ
jgi:flagellar basal-body rod protein FlgF